MKDNLSIIRGYFIEDDGETETLSYEFRFKCTKEKAEELLWGIIFGDHCDDLEDEDLLEARRNDYSISFYVPEELQDIEEFLDYLDNN